MSLESFNVPNENTLCVSVCNLLPFAFFCLAFSLARVFFSNGVSYLLTLLLVLLCSDSFSSATFEFAFLQVSARGVLLVSLFDFAR